MRYDVKGNYRAVWGHDGTNEQIVLTEGETVALDKDKAAFIRADCPGIIVRAKGVKKNALKE